MTHLIVMALSPIYSASFSTDFIPLKYFHLENGKNYRIDGFISFHFWSWSTDSKLVCYIFLVLLLILHTKKTITLVGV